jgi:Phosphotransferase enzyme family
MIVPMDDSEILVGGVANAGRVVREGGDVVRPSSPHSASVHSFLRAVRATGFDGVPEPVSVHEGRERLRFIPGDVPVPPYPGWAQSDASLGSVAGLLRRFHEASVLVPVDPGWSWDTDMAEHGHRPPGRVVCHNDVCLENVVFRDGVAVALLDFDFAAPGEPVWDVAKLARMCVPVDDPAGAARDGWRDLDVASRLRLVADAYGLDAPEREDLMASLDAIIARGGQFVRRQLDAGHPGFIEMVDRMGGMARFDIRRSWFDANKARLRQALA